MTTRSHLFARLALAALIAIGATSAIGSVASATTIPPGPTIEPSKVAGRLGDVSLLDTRGHAIREGDGTTRFLVHLPDDATCPGDSANDQWRWNSFLIPIDADPMQQAYGSAGPEPAWTAGLYPLFENAKQMALSVQFLRRNNAPGQPGIIGAIPETSLIVHAQNQFPGGHYRLGIACTYFNQTTQYWDVAIDITPAVDGDPSALTWTLPDVTPEEIAAVNQSSSSGTGTWVLVGAGALLALVAFVLWRHHAVGNLQKGNQS